MVFLFAIDMMGQSFNSLGKSTAESILFATSNPFIGLFIGLLMTAIIQSSSTSTSMIVAIVATGSITIPDAVPMIMGANIGTTLTSTIVALGFITNKNEFERALAAGTIHDFFNILTVLILFPLEYYYGFLSNLSQTVANLFLDPNAGASATDVGFKLFDAIPITKYIVESINNGFASIILSFILLFSALKILSSQISKLLIDETGDKLDNLIFKNPFKSFGIGAGLTALVQSSSITTSLVIPFVAKGRIKLKAVAPFIIGANIGTTITAFIAVLFKSNAAMTIAVTHLLFNLIGTLIFLPFSTSRKLLIRIASGFGALTIKYRVTGILYIILTFFAIPFALIFFNKSNTEIKELTYLVNGKSNKTIINKSVENQKNPFLIDGIEAEYGGATSKLVNVYQKNNIIFFNNDFFIINNIGFCWDTEKEEGKCQICISDIKERISINSEQNVDSVYVFDLNFYNATQVDSITYQYQIGIKDKLITELKKLNKNSEVIYEEKLTSFSTKY